MAVPQGNSTNSTTSSILQNDLLLAREELTQVIEQLRNLFQKKKGLEEKISGLKSKLEHLSVNSEACLTEFDKEDFPWSEKVKSTLQNVFNLEDFRSHQLAAINATMSGADILLIMPTGAGKSLCFQLPAVLSEGVTVVVSPLIALIEDQLQSLQKLGVSTEILNWLWQVEGENKNTKRIFDALIDPSSNLKMLYVTPEILAKSKRFMNELEKMNRAGRFARLVMDEVHCCSDLGHDFKPDYKFLGIMKTQFPQTPIIGLTATATTNVILDIQKTLNIQGCQVLRDSVHRPNLHYSVIDCPSSKKEQKIDDLAALITTRFIGMSGIIYCLTVKETEEIARKLRDNHGLNCGTYHGQMEPRDRTLIQKQWGLNKVQIIVASCAFGMGINKLDVRFVIHNSIAKSLENYYQESGRAGRDGEKAECILFYNFQDIFRATDFMMKEKNGVKNVYNMVSYCLDQDGCRKRFIANHFGENCDVIREECGNCDNCEKKTASPSMSSTPISMQPLLKNVVSLLENATRLEERMTPLKLMDAWLNKGSPKLRLSSVPIPKYERKVCERVLAHFLVGGFIKEVSLVTPYSKITYLTPGRKSYVSAEEDWSIKLYSRPVTETVSGKDKATKGKAAKGKAALKKGLKKKSKNDGSKSDEEAYVPVKKIARISPITLD